MGQHALHKAGLVEDQNAVLGPQIVSHHTMTLRQDFHFVPESITHEALHGPDLPLFNGNGNRLEGFSLEGTEGCCLLSEIE